MRPVFVSGETFEATVKAVDAEGKPLAQKLTLNVLEQTVVDGKVGEIEVEQHDLTTDKKDGAARQTLKLRKGRQLRAARRRDRSLQQSDHRPIAGADFRRQGPRAAANSGRQAHVQSRRHGRGAIALARRAGAGAGHVPRGEDSRLQAGDARKRREQAHDSDGGEARAEFQSGSGRDDRRPGAERPAQGRSRKSRSFVSTWRPAPSPSSAI